MQLIESGILDLYAFMFDYIPHVYSDRLPQLSWSHPLEASIIDQVFSYLYIPLENYVDNTLSTGRHLDCTGMCNKLHRSYLRKRTLYK